MATNRSTFHTGLYGELDYFIISVLAHSQFDKLAIMSKNLLPVEIGGYHGLWNQTQDTVVRAPDGEVLIVCNREHPMFTSKDEFRTALRQLSKDLANKFADDEELFIQPAITVNRNRNKVDDIENAKKNLLLMQLSVNDIDAITFYEKTSFDEMYNLKITVHDFDDAYGRLSSQNNDEFDPFRTEQRRYLLKETLNFIYYLHEIAWYKVSIKMGDYMNHVIDNPYYKGYTVFDGILDIMVKNLKDMKNAELEILYFIDEHKRGYEEGSYEVYDWFLDLYKSEQWKKFSTIAKALDEEPKFPSYMNILYNAHIYEFILK